MRLLIALFAGLIFLDTQRCFAEDTEPSAPFGRTSTAPVERPQDPSYSVKDPTVVRFNDRRHLFCTVRSEKRSHQIEYLSFADWKPETRPLIRSRESGKPRAQLRECNGRGGAPDSPAPEPRTLS